ncbi:MAG: sensor histidine kinase [Bacteroidota bacterium]|nr:MAG: sensor histidine kinase [Bacteroidota bacterium]
MKRLLISIVSLNFLFALYAQKSEYNDSLNLVVSSPAFSNAEKASILNNLSHKVLENNPQEASEFAFKALELSIKSKNNNLIALSYQNVGTAYYKRNLLDSAGIYCRKAEKIYLENGDTLPLGFVFKELGNIEADNGNYNLALSYYQKSLKIYEKQNDVHNQAVINSNIGALYINLGEIEQMFQYSSIALKFFRKENHKIGIASCLTNLSEYYFQKNDTTNIRLSLNEAIQLFHEEGASINEANALGSLGDYYSVYAMDQDKAINIYKQSMQLLSEIENNNLRMENYRKISLAYYKKQDYKNSLELAKKALEVTDTSNINYMQVNYYLFTYIYMGLRDFPNGEYSFDKYVELSNEVNHEARIKEIAEMEVKFETEKKEKEIIQLTTEKKLRTIMMLSLAGFMLLGSVVAYFVLHNHKQKRIITEQKYSELLKTQQLLATQAVLSGEETERRRLARDLHDGLGGMLSGIKLNLSNLKGNYFLDEEGKTNFDNAINSLDLSVTELRRVAHNLMPEVLLKYGLKEAVSDFCSTLSPGDAIQTEFRFYGIEVPVEQNLEITAFRIIQELVNNALKHSGAKKILVQLVQEESRLSLTVQDDGAGFDIQKIDNSRSFGLSSIQSRVASFNGIIDIHTAPGKGTEVEIEFEI